MSKERLMILQPGEEGESVSDALLTRNFHRTVDDYHYRMKKQN
jgi:hypothetical protein